MVDSSELAELRVSLDRQLAAIGAALSDAAHELQDEGGSAGMAEHHELVRQLGALRDLVAQADAQLRSARELRAELATLLSFARTLRSDVDSLGAEFRRAREERVLAQTAARAERRRRAAEREYSLRRRDVLQAKIIQVAEGIAQGNGAECRRTVPVISLDQDVTVCSVGVASPRRPFRSRRFWLVTLTDTHDDVLVRPT